MLLLGFGMFQGEMHPSPQIVYVDNSTEVIKIQELFGNFVNSCLVLHVRSQLHCGNEEACTTSCRNGPGSCCVWIDVENTNDTPLGYIIYFLPGTDSQADPPCIRVNFPNSTIGQINYVVLAAETCGTRLCVQQTGNSEANPICNTGGIHFCTMVPITNEMTYVDLDLFCTGLCEIDDTVYYVKIVTSTLDSDSEYFCDENGTLPLPSSLRTRTDVPNVESTTRFTQGTSLPLPSSLWTPTNIPNLETTTIFTQAEPGSVITGIAAGIVGLAILVTSLVIVVLFFIAFIRRTPPTRDPSAIDENKNTLIINML